MSCFLLLSACTPNQENIQGLSLKEKKQVLNETFDAMATSFDVAINEQNATLVINNQTVSENTTIQVSTSDIKSSSFDIPIEPITPLISVEVSQPLNKSMKMQIPIEKEENHTIAAVSYNINTKLLETMESFMTEDETLEVLIDTTVDFFITSVAEDLVLADIDTGFRPSVDGFQIGNYSNYWQPNGMCSGMVRGSMYYFLYKKTTLGPLHNQFRETTGLTDFETINFYQDDVDIVKLNSVLQDSDYASNYNNRYFATMSKPADQHFYRMAYHMLISRKPQIVHIQDKPYDLESNQIPTAAHALIVYRILANHAYVYDPNYPRNETLKIVLNVNTGEIEPYIGATTANTDQVVFTNFLYFPLADVLNVPVTASLWDRFLANESLVLNPAYRFAEVEVAFDGVERLLPISKHYITNKSSIVVQMIAPSGSYTQVYNKSQTYIALSDDSLRFTLYLENGDNYTGLEVYLPDTLNTANKVFSGFDWVNIQRKDYEPWTVTSTINDVNPDYYSKQEINQILNRVLISNTLMIYNDKEALYHIYNPENGETFTMKREGNKVSYKIIRPTDNDQLINTFEGIVSSNEKTITGTSVISLQTKGKMYAMSVIMTKNDE